MSLDTFAACLLQRDLRNVFVESAERRDGILTHLAPATLRSCAARFFEMQLHSIEGFERKGKEKLGDLSPEELAILPPSLPQLWQDFYRKWQDLIEDMLAYHKRPGFQNEKIAL